MFLKKLGAIVTVLILSLLITACGSDQVKKDESNTDPQEEITVQAAAKQKTETPEIENIGPHEGINQAPVPINVERVGEHEVNIEMTSQITDIELDKGKMYKAWTFNGTVPGPVIRVQEGDKLTFTLKNMDPKVDHSIDFHSVYAAPNKDFSNVKPNESGTFSYEVGSPGVYMYHCATEPVLQHIANGMYGTMIVEPEGGYPTDNEIDKEITVVQSEFYKDGNFSEMLDGEPEYVLFNGSTQAVKGEMIQAKVGDKIRINFLDVGPNEVSSFHVIGSQLETVYVDGDPRNVLNGLQTAMVPVSGSMVVEFTVKEAGIYPFVTHAFDHVTKGALGKIEVTE
ncbi:multicopper oxidase domain-containing protein [Virgibacillus sp. JSM 102003]|uniref:multicopper oxidase domain-containing protein n=1 Tax=Virgibacillus sp. JSM 102003 TaxID=1562108 RepID=UPI0035C03477